MKNLAFVFLLAFCTAQAQAQAQEIPTQIEFVRQAVTRPIFETSDALTFSELNPSEIVGLQSQYPATVIKGKTSDLTVANKQITLESKDHSEQTVWFGGFNPYATYTLDIESTKGNGEIGLEFASNDCSDLMRISLLFGNSKLKDIRLSVAKDSNEILNSSISYTDTPKTDIAGKYYLQMLGSGFTLYKESNSLPIVIGHYNFNKLLDLRETNYIHQFQSKLYIGVNRGKATINSVKSSLTTGIGLADIRAITYENGDPFLEDGRLWYTMSVRGRGLDHHLQGIFSMNPTIFDLRMEGVVVFDRGDGLWRNEIASHLFYDRNKECWRGITTGFSAFANIDKEKKQLLIIESDKDPRFGFSVMKAKEFGVIGDIEDPHLVYDNNDKKWRILTCTNIDGYKAIVMESDHWDRGFEKIAGPGHHDATGTSIQKINGTRYCFSGSSERAVYVYSYPDMKEVGTLNMNLPPWDKECGTRIWPNVVDMGEGYPFRYIALMMDRYDYPGVKTPRWTYGAVYLYYGYIPSKDSSKE